MSNTTQRKPKIPFAVKAIRWTMPKLHRIAPILAKRFAIRIFFSPFRYKVPLKESEATQKAKTYQETIAGKKIQFYVWGNGEKIVTLIHGWSGRGAQFYALLPKLLKEGYTVVSFDGPAHGASEGRATNILEFEEVLQFIEKKYSKIDAILAHSFGGAAALYAIAEGLSVSNLTVIGSPTNGKEIIDEFIKRLNGHPSIAPYFESYVLKLIGKPFSFYEGLESIKRIKSLSLLIIHDKKDREVPYSNATRLKQAYPEAELYLTEGLGHTRILKDQKVVDLCIAQLKESTETFA